MIHAPDFFRSPDGHPPTDLQVILNQTRRAKGQSNILFLCGDAVFDSKPGSAKNIFDERTWGLAPTQYGTVLWPKRVMKDVAFFGNLLAPTHLMFLNCAVRGASPETRVLEDLLPQEKLVRDYMEEQDILAVGLGSELLTRQLKRISWLVRAFPVGWLTPHVRRLARAHRHTVEAYIKKLTQHTRPHALLFCHATYLGKVETPHHEKNLKKLLDVFTNELNKGLYLGLASECCLAVRPDLEPDHPDQPDLVAQSEAVALCLLNRVPQEFSRGILASPCTYSHLDSFDSLP
jgi:hypothetical protein